MRKTVCLLMVFLMLLATLASCGDAQTTGPTEAPTTSVVNLMPDGSVIIGELPSDYFSGNTDQGEKQTQVQYIPQNEPYVQSTQADTTDSQLAWIIDVYTDVYNTTKASGTFMGTDAIEISGITVDGSQNASVDSIVHSVMGAVYKPQTLPLPPYSEENDFPVCIFHEEDAQSAEWKDLGNGQAEIIITPKASVNSTLGTGQGKMFNVINDIRFIFDYMPDFAFGWSEGDINSNISTTYDGGFCRVVYDRVSMKMISAEYVMKLCIDIKNMEVLFSSHNISVNMTYTQSFPAAS